RGHGAPRCRSGRTPYELVRAGRWRAARHGLAGKLLHPVHHTVSDAADVLAVLVDHVRLALSEAGDLERVEEGIARAHRSGGAGAQRAAFERTGSIDGVVDDLVDRTARAWA
ncbi:MAG: hypothetical protein WB767_16240, partial [Nocardioides sp.]